LVDLARARRTLGPSIFWETDSISFWILSDSPEPSIIQIGVPNGEVLRSLKIENPSGRAIEVYQFNIYPIGRRFLLGFNNDCCYLFDLDTGDFLYRQDHYYGLSPDTQLVESYGENGLGGIFKLEFSPDLGDVIPIPVAQINSQFAWSNTPELAWAESDRDGAGYTVRRWSHDSLKIAFHQSILQDGEAVGFTGVYFLDTQEVRILGQDSWETADLFWSPDDSAIAVLPSNTGYAFRSGTQLTVFTLDGSTIPVLNENELFRVYSVNWVPHQWLQ
jgi:hypothetical protein